MSGIFQKKELRLHCEALRRTEGQTSSCRGTSDVRCSGLSSELFLQSDSHLGDERLIDSAILLLDRRVEHKNLNPRQVLIRSLRKAVEIETLKNRGETNRLYGLVREL